MPLSAGTLNQMHWEVRIYKNGIIRERLAVVRYRILNKDSAATLKV